ncbi:MAG: DUF3048 domain-containing protein [Candidatus Shapirobacteria bacterium]
MKNRLLGVILGGMVLYLVSAGSSWAVFRYLNTPSAEGLKTGLKLPIVGKGALRIDTSAPKTAVCPINGGMFTEAEKKIWEGRRPLTVMIENHQDSRPQSGLSAADVIYEAVAEGGITRFLAVYYCGVAAGEVIIGPVRSARTYFVDWASEYGDYPLYAHVGGANLPGPANALGQIGDYGWLAKRNDMNQFSLGFPVFWRDYERLGHEVATEHTMYSNTEKLWEVAEKRGLEAVDDKGNRWDKNFVGWEFKDEAPEDKRGGVAKITLGFMGDYADYLVEWQYDKSNNVYRRFNGGQPHKDLNNDVQLEAKNVVVVFMQEKGPIDELKHMLYGTTGKGKALVFQDGQGVEVSWQKAKRADRTIFTDVKGKEIVFNRGPIWIEVVATGREVKY